MEVLKNILSLSSNLFCFLVFSGQDYKSRNNQMQDYFNFRLLDHINISKLNLKVKTEMFLFKY